MSLIEQAAKRLEELRRAGAEIPDTAAPEAARWRDPTVSSTSQRRKRRFVVLPRARPRRRRRRRQRSRRHGLRLLAAMRSRARCPALGRSRAKSNRYRPRAAQSEGIRHGRRAEVADRRRIPGHQASGSFTNARRTAGSAIRNGNLIMVTSALPGEGKNFHRSESGDERGDGASIPPCCWSTATLPIRSCQECSARSTSPGLLELLTTGEMDVSDAILRTNVENLSVLPAGAHHRRQPSCLPASRWRSSFTSSRLAIRTASSSSTRRRCFRPRRRALLLRTWDRS